MFSIRQATSSDHPAIQKLIRQVRINPTGLKWERFLVAVDQNDQVIGCGQVKSHSDGSQELASIAVIAEYRQQGIASTLIEQLLAQSTGDLYLMCRSSLGSFYERFGFQPIDGNDLPPYFKKMKRLTRLLTSLDKNGETLLVMMKPGEPPG
jgi:N-acetylglutamate synthase-like GNAT family acetyltransferase